MEYLLRNIKKSPNLPGMCLAITAHVLGGISTHLNNGFVVFIAVTASTNSKS
ncbi:MAG: hypothetical protein JNM34_08665 [Chthonomonadaceae bacterium]|nr:hypothetical protein [Chthonomonadaceae bacterium]